MRFDSEDSSSTSHNHCWEPKQKLWRSTPRREQTRCCVESSRGGASIVCEKLEIRMMWTNCSSQLPSLRSEQSDIDSQASYPLNPIDATRLAWGKLSSWWSEHIVKAIERIHSGSGCGISSPEIFSLFLALDHVGWSYTPNRVDPWELKLVSIPAIYRVASIRSMKVHSRAETSGVQGKEEALLHCYIWLKIYEKQQFSRLKVSAEEHEKRHLRDCGEPLIYLHLKTSTATSRFMQLDADAISLNNIISWSGRPPPNSSQTILTFSFSESSLDQSQFDGMALRQELLKETQDANSPILWPVPKSWFLTCWWLGHLLLLRDAWRCTSMQCCNSHIQTKHIDALRLGDMRVVWLHLEAAIARSGVAGPRGMKLQVGLVCS